MKAEGQVEECEVRKERGRGGERGAGHRKREMTEVGLPIRFFIAPAAGLDPLLYTPYTAYQYMRW